MSLRPHLALLVAEQCSDLQTLMRLMQTCREMHHLLSEHERSIVKEIISQRHSSLVSTPSGSILTSFDQERLVTEPTGFEYIQEIDMRKRRITALFDTSSLLRQTLEKDRSYMSLPHDHMDKLIAGLKRAVMIADRLADTVADTMTTSKQNPSLHGSPDQTNFIIRQSHRSQIAYITGSLSPLDLAYLGTLTDVAAIAYTTVHPYGDGDPSPWPRITAFKEALLRQGSMVLWSWMGPRGAVAGSNGSNNDIVINAGTGAGTGTGSGPTVGVANSTSGDGTAVASSSTSTSTPNGSGAPPRRSPNENSAAFQKRLAAYVEDVINAVLDEIEQYETGRGASSADEFDDESLILPGLYRTVHEAFARKTGWAFERAAKEMELMVLWDIRN